MVLKNNINMALATSNDIANAIVRKHYNRYIIGLVNKSPSFLHKRKRFRPGGIFCEKIFGTLYTCNNKNCKTLKKFNINPVLNNLCTDCGKFMQINFKRKYRFGAVFLNFPIINYYYFKNFIDLTTPLNKIKKNKKNQYCSIFNTTIFTETSVIQSKFLNLIDLFYKFIGALNLFKNKLLSLNNTKILNTLKLGKISKNVDNGQLIKKIFITLFPILPAGLRPYALDNKKFRINAKLNRLYNSIVDTNNSVGKDLKYNSKTILMLYVFIEIALDFAKSKDILKQDNYLYNKLSGKYGIFRQNLLGFRVDYSGRSTIVPDPSAPMNEIGLPFNMLSHYVLRYEPSIPIEYFYEAPIYNTTLMDKVEFFNSYLRYYSILANRAPTLHKMNVQSFHPSFVEGNSVKFMPLLCSGYNADFDGDQMGIFSIVKRPAVEESLLMLKPIANIFSPTTKEPVFSPTQGALLGHNMLSNYNNFKFIDGGAYSSYTDALESCSSNDILIDSPMLVRVFNLFYITTGGRLMLNFNFNNK